MYFDVAMPPAATFDIVTVPSEIVKRSCEVTAAAAEGEMPSNGEKCGGCSAARLQHQQQQQAPLLARGNGAREQTLGPAAPRPRPGTRHTFERAYRVGEVRHCLHTLYLIHHTALLLLFFNLLLTF